MTSASFFINCSNYYYHLKNYLNFLVFLSFPPLKSTFSAFHTHLPYNCLSFSLLFIVILSIFIQFFNLRSLIFDVWNFSSKDSCFVLLFFVNKGRFSRIIIVIVVYVSFGIYYKVNGFSFDCLRLCSFGKLLSWIIFILNSYYSQHYLNSLL
jgi:hypothetical protein